MVLRGTARRISIGLQVHDGPPGGPPAVCHPFCASLSAKSRQGFALEDTTF
jgi:hypothetical protein